MRSLLLAAMLVGCSPSRATPTAAPVPSVTPEAKVAIAPPPSAPTSQFHVIGRSHWSSLKTANPARLCAIGGAMFVCGTGALVRVQGDELVKDSALEKGLLRREDGALHGRIHAMLGTFPDDAWLVMRSGFNTGTIALYRYGKEWSLAKKWKIETVMGDVKFLPYKPGQIAALDASGGAAFAVELVGASVVMPPIPKAKKPDEYCMSWLREGSLQLGSNGALIVRGARCDADGAGWLEIVPGKKTLTTHEGEAPALAEPVPAWRVESDKLQRRLADGSYEDVLLPESPSHDALRPFEVRADGESVLVAARYGTNDVAILRNAPAKEPLEF